MSERPRRKHTEVLRALIDPARERVVDVGCGHGALTRRLARNGGEVVGLDPQESAIRSAVGRETHARFLVGMGEALPLAAASRDVVLFFNALHHVPAGAMDAALGEAYRVLGPGGRLVAVEPLAEGAVFELMRPVEDESAVRAAADLALLHATDSSDWTLCDRFEYGALVRYESFAAFRDGLLSVDPTRAAALCMHESWLEQAFQAAAHVESDACWLDQPCRLTVLRRNAPAD